MKCKPGDKWRWPTRTQGLIMVLALMVGLRVARELRRATSDDRQAVERETELREQLGPKQSMPRGASGEDDGP